MLLWQMPITIRNKALEERIRAVAKRTGETPAALIARLSCEEDERLKAEDLGTNRVAAMKRLRAEAQQMFTDDDRVAIKQAMEDIYDEDGLPR
jgi:uncharacterized protein YecE (DUF72 family)